MIFKNVNPLIFAFIFGWLFGLIFEGIFSFGFFWLLTFFLAGGLAMVIKFFSPADTWFYLWLTIFLLAFSLGQWRLSVAERKSYDFRLDQKMGQTISLVGQVKQEPRLIRDSDFVFVLKADEFDVKLSVIAPYPPPLVGQTVSVVGKLRPNLYESTEMTKYQLSSYSSAIVINDHISWLARLYGFKNNLSAILNKILPEPQASLAQAMMFGNRPEVYWQTIFRRLGLAHIFVLSGYHLSVIVGGLALVLSFFNRRVALALSLLLAFPFVLMVGSGLSISRAFIMAGIVSTAILFGQLYRPARALLIAAMILSFFNPPILLSSLSFQLSFLATLGIIWLAKPINNSLSFIRLTLVRNLLAVTLAAQLFVLPVIAFHFGWPSILSPLANLFILPLMPAVIFFGWLTVFLFYLYPPFGYLVGWIVFGLITLQMKIATAFLFLDNNWGIIGIILTTIIGVFIVRFFRGRLSIRND